MIYWTTFNLLIIYLQSTFADNASLFSHAFDKYKAQRFLNSDLQIINNRVFQWKMQLNPDLDKQAQEVYFSKKIKQ